MKKDHHVDDLGYAHVDLDRQRRQGMPEVIFGQGKTPEQILGIVGSLAANDARSILVTRTNAAVAESLTAAGVPLVFHDAARVIVAYPAADPPPPRGDIVLVSAGTSDLPVCEEAAVTAETLGSKVTRLYDVGVAGLHRLLAHLDTLRAARVLIVVAGMEGALPSVVGGLVACPVIAVPTSVGYGAHFAGVTPLLAMLNSCAAGVGVVNIDNGFGAGVLAHRINMIGA